METVNHNKRGLRCPSCWEQVVVKAEAEVKVKPARRRRAKNET
jgi:DNA-directed RNA polymerase subunit RPC12/RpoP